MNANGSVTCHCTPACIAVRLHTGARKHVRVGCYPFDMRLPPSFRNLREVRAMLRALAMLFTILAVDASAATPEPVDCGKLPARSLERLMCRSATLAGLEQEMNRLLALATAGNQVAATPIRQQQEAWVARRAGCAKNKTQEACLRELYVSRIAAIRAASRAARGADSKGTSLGPFAFRCEGLDSPLNISYVNVPPRFAWVMIKDQGNLLVQQRSGSGARYEGNGTLFWEAQGEARWRATTGSPETVCTRASGR